MRRKTRCFLNRNFNLGQAVSEKEKREKATIEDCLENFMFKNQITVLKAGQVIDFTKEDKHERSWI